MKQKGKIVVRYRTDKYTTQVERLTFDRETECFLIVNNVKFQKQSDWYSHFETELEALRSIEHRLITECNMHDDALEKARTKLREIEERIRGLE